MGTSNPTAPASAAILNQALSFVIGLPPQDGSCRDDLFSAIEPRMSLTPIPLTPISWTCRSTRLPLTRLRLLNPVSTAQWGLAWEVSWLLACVGGSGRSTSGPPLDISPYHLPSHTLHFTFKAREQRGGLRWPQGTNMITTWPPKPSVLFGYSPSRCSRLPVSGPTKRCICAPRVPTLVLATPDTTLIFRRTLWKAGRRKAA